ncbi:MAG TPA: hypothetical protein VGL89_03520 [Candidatus Koribacter sp.]
MLSDAFIIALTLSILTRIPFAFIRGLHLLGGLFVLYLAWDAWSTFRHFDAATAAAQSHAVESVWKAVVINLLNPNPYLGWSLVLGPLRLRGWHAAPRNGLAIGAGFYFALVGTTILVVLVFDLARNTGPRVARQLLAISVLALAAFGAYQLWLAITAR